MNLKLKVEKMESSQEEVIKEKPEEKIIENKTPEETKPDDEPKKPKSVAGAGTTFSSAPNEKAKEVKVRRPPKKHARNKNKK